MSRTNSNTKAAQFPAAVNVRAIRIGLALAIAASLLAFAVRAEAQEQVRSGAVSIDSVASVSNGTSE